MRVILLAMIPLVFLIVLELKFTILTERNPYAIFAGIVYSMVCLIMNANKNDSVRYSRQKWKSYTR